MAWRRAWVSGWRGVNSVQESWSGTIEMSKVPSRCACGDDLFLVHADQRPEHRHVRGLIDHRHVVERLRRDLADDVAGDERARAHVARDPLRDAQHQPPVDDHAQIALARSA